MTESQKPRYAPITKHDIVGNPTDEVWPEPVAVGKSPDVDDEASFGNGSNLMTPFLFGGFVVSVMTTICGDVVKGEFLQRD